MYFLLLLEVLCLFLFCYALLCVHSSFAIILRRKREQLVALLLIVHSKAVVLLLLIYCLMNFPLFVGVLFLSLFCYAFFCVHSSFAIILKRKRKLVALLSFFYRFSVTIYVQWLFLMVPWVGLQYVIAVFPDHTHLLTNMFQSLFEDKYICCASMTRLLV